MAHYSRAALCGSESTEGPGIFLLWDRRRDLMRPDEVGGVACGLADVYHSLYRKGLRCPRDWPTAQRENRAGRQRAKSGGKGTDYGTACQRSRWIRRLVGNVRAGSEGRVY